MKYDELPENMPWQINELKHYVGTILSDVLYSLESAESQEEFRSQVDSSIGVIISEAKKVCEVMGTGNRTLVHGYERYSTNSQRVRREARVRMMTEGGRE